MSSVERVIRMWQAERTAINPGASTPETASLESCLGATLPADVRSFYATANGMPEYSTDSRFVSFWSIEQILRENAAFPRADESGGHRDVAFADVCIFAYQFWLRVRAGGAISVFADAPGREIASFREFLDLYLHHPRELGI